MKSQKKTIDCLMIFSVLLGTALWFIWGAKIAFESYSLLEWSRLVHWDLHLQYWILVLMFASLFYKFIPMGIYAASPWVALALGMSHVFDIQIHALMLKMNVYHYFGIQGPDSNISPEYARVLIWMIIALIALVNVMIKSNRSFQRIFITMIGMSMFMTSALFHTLTVFEVKTLEKQNLQEMSYWVLSEDEKAFQKRCQWKEWSCWSGPNENSVYRLSDVAENTQERIHENALALQKAHEGSHIDWRERSNSLNFNRLATEQWSLGKSSAGWKLIKDEHYLKNTMIRHQVIFGVLSSCAHLVWFFGGFLLMLQHLKRKKQKIINDRR